VGILVSFKNYDLLPRYDGNPWTTIEIYEAATEDGPFTTLIDTQDIIPVAYNPADPEPVSFTTSEGTIDKGWYMVRFTDGVGGAFDTDPIHNVPANEIMATLEDVNAHLDGEVIEATPDNTDLVQVSVARVIRGYLSPLYDSATLMAWATPETTPQIIREIASMLIASQVYFNEAARTSLIIDDDNFAQRLYDQAMALLQRVVDGLIIIPPDEEGGGEVIGPVLEITDEDFFPVDDTDRAFTMGMQL